MKLNLKKSLVVCVAALLAGCGDIEWFPEPKPAAPAAESKVKVTEVGTYVSSYRSAANNYTVTTTRGAFATYTSLTAPVKTAVSLNTYSDSTTGLVIGRMLSAGSNSILVREILALVE